MVIKLRNVEEVYKRANNALMKLNDVEAEPSVAGKSLDEARDMMTREPQRNTWNLLHTVKRGFNDIQHQVATGRFPGLALTDGYREMKQVLENPAFEEMPASDHGLTGGCG